ncbi:hypothetical protein YC2023_043845 [Brassica napus]
MINDGREIHYPVVEVASRSKLSVCDVERSQLVREMKEHEKRVSGPSIDYRTYILVVLRELRPQYGPGFDSRWPPGNSHADLLWRPRPKTTVWVLNLLRTRSLVWTTTVGPGHSVIKKKKKKKNTTHKNYPLSHCSKLTFPQLFPDLASETNLSTSPLSLSAPDPGLILATSSTTEHSGFPPHHPPGVKPSWFVRISSSLSILSIALSTTSEDAASAVCATQCSEDHGSTRFWRTQARFVKGNDDLFPPHNYHIALYLHQTMI